MSVEIHRTYEEFAAVVDDFGAGTAAVVIAESPDGSAGGLMSQLPPDVGPVTRAAAGEATKGRMGCLMEELAIDDLDGRVVVVEQAQWSDPTSLGRLQRHVRAASSPYLLVVVHRSLFAGEDWAIQRLAETARRHSRLHRIRIGESEMPAPDPPADPAARDLLLASSLVSNSLPVPVVARFLGVGEEEALGVAEGLVQSGHLHQTRRGFRSVATTTSLGAGEARLGHTAARLAAVLEESEGDSAVVGSLLLVADDPYRAYPHLVAAAHRAGERAAAGEAYYLAADALRAGQEAGFADPEEEGKLHLLAARYLRAAGRSDLAGSHLDEAVSLLRGVDRIDAFGYAAAVADDRQHPQEAERILAMGEWEAIRQGESAKLGSLAAFHARALNRIGFAGESDALMAKAEALLKEHGGAAHRVNAENNQAWIAFDRGQMRLADMHFTHVRDMTDAEDTVALADKEAWRARVLFAVGRVDEAMAAVSAARELSARGEVEAPLFLAELALTEGNLAFGRFDEALAASDRVLDLVEQQLHAWENMARAQRALVLTRMGRTDDAKDELAAALAATPPGTDGWRWGSRCRAIELEVEARAGGTWDRGAAEDLADLFLQARYFGWAAEMMSLMAEQQKDADVAEEAMALALQIGNPLVAARAAQAGGLWRRPAGSGCVRAVRAMERHIPEDWADDWRSLPGVSEALAAPDPGEQDVATEKGEVLERALQRAGLAGDTILSPAQRRSRGLVRRRRRRRPLQVAAAVVGVAAVAAFTSLAVAQLGEDPVPVTIVQSIVESPEPTLAEPLSREETQIDVPSGVEFLFGVAPYRGGPARTGTMETTGAPRVDGYYWTYETAGPIVATPVAYGRNLLVPSTDGTLYALDQTTGDVAWTLQTEGRITASPDVVTVEAGEGQRPALAVVAGDDGVVRARDAVVELMSEEWSVPLGSRITSSPVISEDMVFVATTGGFVHALDVGGGSEVWRFPAEGESLGPISAPLAYHDGLLYVGTEEGHVYLLEAATGQEHCSWFASAAIVANPIVSDGAVYIPTRGNTIFLRPAGACQGTVPDRLPLYGTETAVEVPPAISGDLMYLPSGQFLYAIDLRSNAHFWPASTVDAGEAITAAPVVADGVVYFGTQSGLVRAVDGQTGAMLWEWATGNIVRASPTVVDGAVFVAGGDGMVYALGAR